LLFAHADAIQSVTLDDVRRVISTYFIPSNSVAGYYIPSGTDAKVILQPSTDGDIAKKIAGLKQESMDVGVLFDGSLQNIKKQLTKEMVGGGFVYMVPQDTRGGKVHASFTLNFGDERSLFGKSFVSSLAGMSLQLGTTTRSEQDIQDALLALDASISTQSAGAETLVISVEAKKETFVETLKLLEEMLKHPVVTDAQFSRLKEELIAGITSQQDQPQSQASDRISSYGNPFPKGDVRAYVPPDEAKRLYRAVTKEHVLQFMKEFYSARSITGAIVGEYDVEKTKSTLHAMFDTWKSGPAYTRLTLSPCPTKTIDESIEIPEKSDAYITAQSCMSLRRDDPAYVALEVGNYAFGGDGMNSRLMKRIREKEGLSYGTGSFIYANDFEAKGIFGFDATAAPENIAKVKESFKEEFTTLVTQGITQKELDASKRSYTEYMKQTRSTSSGLVQYLAGIAAVERDIDAEIAEENLRSKLTVADVQLALKKFFDVSALSFVQAGTFKK
jgi:zinc protease